MISKILFSKFKYLYRFLFAGAFFSVYAAQPQLLIPDEAFQILNFKVEGYPKEYHAALSIPFQKIYLVRNLVVGLPVGYNFHTTGASVFIGIPEVEKESFTGRLHAIGILPVWVEVDKS